MNRRNIIALLLSLSLLLVQAEALAVAIRVKDEDNFFKNTFIQTDRDVFFDDFTGDTEGAAPAAYSVGGIENGQVIVEKIDGPNGNKKNCLALIDTSNDSKNQYAGVIATGPLEKQKENSLLRPVSSLCQNRRGTALLLWSSKAAAPSPHGLLFGLLTAYSAGRELANPANCPCWCVSAGYMVHSQDGSGFRNADSGGPCDF